MKKFQSHLPTDSILKSKYLKNFERISFKQNAGDASSSESSDEEFGDVEVQFVIDKKPQTEPSETTDKKPQAQRVKLSSELNPGLELRDSYVVTRPDRDPTAASHKLRNLALSLAEDNISKRSVIVQGFEKRYTVPPYTETVRQLKAERKKEREKTKGPNWFGLGAPEITDELKNDLEVLRMRAVLDPKQFYKKNDLKVLPKYFQVGTVMDNAADFYHARVPKKDRKRTLVEELLADAEFTKYNKKKYSEAAARKQKVSRKAARHMNRLKKRKV
ncbi:deoxynucleotidyltransferase terminal-interacting protein 2-like [Ornithodoros turicata]|uniref:deoxynucleotidyltransferase terminal-interacting protein 2-like n=1 Tax=Ornithodoros turicata TaxID=34597 RepID=UPI003138F03F